jgi:hypothetical protein
MLSAGKRFKRKVRVSSHGLLFGLTISKMDLPCKIIYYPPLWAMPLFKLGGGAENFWQRIRPSTWKF